MGSGGSKKQVVGYKYYLGMHLVLGHGPFDSLTKIEVDEKEAWSGNSTGGTITINKPDLFGGEGREGGISGALYLLMGKRNQGQNSYLAEKLGAVPCFRGVVSIVLKQMYVGLNPYLKQWGFWGKRIHVRSDGQAQWYDAKAEIQGDMNPAHIIRECLTDAVWGMGYPEIEIDNKSFTKCADTLYNEKMGMSLIWDKESEIKDFIDIILNHINASLYVSRTTGKWVLKLVRDDYDKTSLLVLDENNIKQISGYKKAAINELQNTITAVFWDKKTGKDNSVTVQDISLVAQQGCTIGLKRQYPGFTNAELATTAATRDLLAAGTPLVNCTLYTNRTAAHLNIGDVFILNYPKYGATNVIMRLTNIELGTPDSNLVKIDCTQDIYSAPEAVFSAPPDSQWERPTSSPAPAPYQILIEAPYWEIAQLIGDEAAQAIHPTGGYIIGTCVRPSGDSIAARMFTSVSSGVSTFTDKAPVQFCPTCISLNDADKVQTVISVSAGTDLDLIELGSYAVWQDEIIRVDSVDLENSLITVGRGCLDTVPQNHAANERLFFADNQFATDGQEYALNQTVYARFTPSTGAGALDVINAPASSTKINARHYKPYPPGQFKINGASYPPIVLGASDVVVTWAGRNRLTQTGAKIIDTNYGNIAPEANTTYSIQIKKGATIIKKEEGLTSTTYTFLATDLAANYGPLQVDLWASRDGVQSWQTHSHIFERVQ